MLVFGLGRHCALGLWLVVLLTAAHRLFRYESIRHEPIRYELVRLNLP